MWAWAGPDAAQLAEAPDLAALVEDRREGKEHREFEEAWTSCSFGIAIGSGCMDFLARNVRAAPYSTLFLRASFGIMKTQFCIVGATHGTGLLITQQLLQSGAMVRVLARNPDKARQLLGNRVDVCHGDVTDACSVCDAIAEEQRAIFFTVAATGGIDGRGLFASKTTIRNVTYQGLINLVDAARSRGFQGRIILPSVIGADRSSVMIRFLDKIKSGLQRNIIEREIYLRASGLDYTIVRAPILTNAPAGDANIRIARATNKLTAGPKISRGDLARVLILASQENIASRKTFDLFSSKGVAPSDEQILEQIGQIPADI